MFCRIELAGPIRGKGRGRAVSTPLGARWRGTSRRSIGPDIYFLAASPSFARRWRISRRPSLCVREDGELADASPDPGYHHRAIRPGCPTRHRMADTTYRGQVA